MSNDFSNILSSTYSDKKPFVAFSKPNSDEVKAMLQKDTTLNEVVDFTESGFVFAPFDATQSAILLPPDIEIYAKRSSYKLIKLPQTSATEIAKLKDTKAKSNHIDLVKKGIDFLAEGNAKKVVLSRAINVRCTTDPIAVFLSLLSLYPNAYCYVWYHPKVGLWLGATPETLFKTNRNHFKTMSLAGTMPYTKDELPVWGEKEKEEQALVTEYIASKINHTVSSLTIGETETVRAGQLWHLSTTLSGIFKITDMPKLVADLHPTPAVCGMPMNLSKQFILANEGYNREYYTGFLGELNAKVKVERTKTARNQENKAYVSVQTMTDLYVNLRCMKLQEELATIYVGGGITPASIAEKEWDETEAKAMTMRTVLKTTI